MKHQLVFASVCSFSLFLSGCMVGPKYVKPTVATAPAFKEQPPESFKEVDGWKPAQPDDQTFRGNWWEIFSDPQLNALEEELTVSNQNLKVSEARFRQARAMIRFNRAAQFPTISTSPSVVNEREGMRPLQVSNRSDGLASRRIHHLDPRTMRQIQHMHRRIGQQIVPPARPANHPLIHYRIGAGGRRGRDRKHCYSRQRNNTNHSVQTHIENPSYRG